MSARVAEVTERENHIASNSVSALFRRIQVDARQARPIHSCGPQKRRSIELGR